MYAVSKNDVFAIPAAQPHNRAPSCTYTYAHWHLLSNRETTCSGIIVFGASRYGVIVDPIEHMSWELTYLGDGPPPAAAPAVDFELLDMAPEGGASDVAQISDWVELKISSLCKLAEVHVFLTWGYCISESVTSMSIDQ